MNRTIKAFDSSRRITLAMGADAVAIGTSALIAIGCRQYRICHTGRCPMGIATQDPELRKNLDEDQSASRLGRFLSVCNNELGAFARLTGHADVHDLGVDDLCTVMADASICGLGQAAPNPIRLVMKHFGDEI